MSVSGSALRRSRRRNDRQYRMQIANASYPAPHFANRDLVQWQRGLDYLHQKTQGITAILALDKR